MDEGRGALLAGEKTNSGREIRNKRATWKKTAEILAWLKGLIYVQVFAEICLESWADTFWRGGGGA